MKVVNSEEEAYLWREDERRHLLDRIIFKERFLKVNHLQWVVKNMVWEFHRSARSRLKVLKGINADFKKNSELITESLRSLMRRLWWLLNLDLPVSGEDKPDETTSAKELSNWYLCKYCTIYSIFYCINVNTFKVTISSICGFDWLQFKII